MDNNKALEDLAFIKQIIQESKKSIIYGQSFIVWGLLIPLGLINTYVCIQIKEYSFINIGWFIVFIPGIILSILDVKKQKQRNCEDTFVDKITSGLWKACGISMATIGIIGMLGISIDGIFISPIICLILAVSYFVTGELHKIKWLRNLSYAYWIGAIVMLVFPIAETLLIMAVIMILFQFVPGVILQRKLKDQI